MKQITSKSFQPSESDKAFVYQQAQELASSMQIPGTVFVFLEKLKSKKALYAVTFTIQSSLAPMIVCSKNVSLLDACLSAKKQMEMKLQTLFMFASSIVDRDALIDEVKKHPYIH